MTSKMATKKLLTLKFQTLSLFWLTRPTSHRPNLQSSDLKSLSSPTSSVSPLSLLVVTVVLIIFKKNQQDSAAAPKDSTRHPFLTPVRPPPIKEVGSTILRNASDRIAEILRENRRRLDAGEDPSTIRSTLELKSLLLIQFHSSLFPLY